MFEGIRRKNRELYSDNQLYLIASYNRKTLVLLQINLHKLLLVLLKYYRQFGNYL